MELATACLRIVCVCVRVRWLTFGDGMRLFKLRNVLVLVSTQ